MRATFLLTAALTVALALAAAPAAAQIDFDISGFWDQPATGTVIGPGIAAIFSLIFGLYFIVQLPSG